MSCPPNNGTAQIIMLGPLDPVSHIDVPWSIAGLEFPDVATALSFTLTGGPLTVGAGGINNKGLLVQTLDSHIILGAPQSLDEPSRVNIATEASPGTLPDNKWPSAFTVCCRAYGWNHRHWWVAGSRRTQLRRSNPWEVYYCGRYGGPGP